ncbi:MAG: MoxR family ATPase [Gemmatimonadetes bacterium]|nr:MAG: MoxR family ATPase [Gemmatimonadota bacterium]
MENYQHHAEHFKATFERIEQELGKVIVGQRAIIRQVLLALFVRGNVLLEGVPGLGKTLLVRSLAQVMDLQFSRIQFTPDLMPADILGTNIVEENERGQRFFRFQHGPIFANLILADEINRATPKTQSALLEAMQEHSVTVAGEVRQLDEPFFVLATQNPLEMEGTYPLPEAQLDRFLFKIQVTFPSHAELSEIIDRTTTGHQPTLEKVTSATELIALQRLVPLVPIANHVKDYALRLVLATHPEQADSPEITKQYIRYGSSPRGVQAIILAAKALALLDDRYNVSFDDIQAVFHPALRHRLIRNFEGEAEGILPDTILDQILTAIPTDSLLTNET